MDARLEAALRFAGSAGDIESLKALARQENQRARNRTALICAIIQAVGEVDISPQTWAEQVCKADPGFSMQIHASGAITVGPL